MAQGPTWKQQGALGPVVWWVRNDMRLVDNPVARLAVGEALVDSRSFAAVVVLDPRFFEHSPYGRVTDPEFSKSIPARKPISFGNRKCSALRARFLLQCVRALAGELAAHNTTLHVCHGRPEDVFGSLPQGSLLVCQEEPVSVECSDVEVNVEGVLQSKGGVLRREWGAMSLYHKEDLPFRFKDSEQLPSCYTQLGQTLGWDDIWSTPERSSCVTPVRPPVAAPSTFPAAPDGLQLPGLIPKGVLVDDTATLRQLGYSDAEIATALGQDIPAGGEPEARSLLEAWLAKQVVGGGDNPQSAVFWDLPVGFGPGAGHDALQWANLAKPDGWMRVSHYLAVGCVSAREIFARAASCPNFTGVVHRLLWREWHRLNAIRYGRRFFWLQGPGRVERPWSWDSEQAEAWKQGRTGVPYIDACMRELQQTGWLAYKGRKTVAFFLVFGLGVDWRLGAYHFEDVLLDYDCAMNYGNWVTVAAVDKPPYEAWGQDATVTELVAARRKDVEYKLSAEMANDPSGVYIRRWVPELAALADSYIHQPWAAPEASSLSYPAPLVGPLQLSTSAADWEGKEEFAEFAKPQPDEGCSRKRALEEGEGSSTAKSEAANAQDSERGAESTAAESTEAEEPLVKRRALEAKGLTADTPVGSS